MGRWRWGGRTRGEGSRSPEKGEVGTDSGPGDWRLPGQADRGHQGPELATHSSPPQDQAPSGDGGPTGLAHSHGLVMGADRRSK